MIEVNLHPDEERDRTAGGPDFSLSLPDLEGFGGLEALRSDPWHASFLIFLVLVPLVVGLMWYQQSSRAGTLETRLEEARADSARLADLRALSDSITARRSEIRDRIDLVQELDQNRFAWAHLMDELSRALPPEAWLTEINRRSPLPDLAVEVSGAAASALIITDFVQALEASRFFGEVRIVDSQRTETGGIQGQAFTLQVFYTPPPSSAVETRPMLAGGP